MLAYMSAIYYNRCHRGGIAMNYKYTDLTTEEQRLVDMIISAYASVMGYDKWNSLSAEEQHDVIMKITENAIKC